MLGVDDFALILVATTVANLVVEVGAEVVAEWIVHGRDGIETAASAGATQAENVTWIVAQGTEMTATTMASTMTTLGQYATSFSSFTY